MKVHTVEMQIAVTARSHQFSYMATYMYLSGRNFCYIIACIKAAFDYGFNRYFIWNFYEKLQCHLSQFQRPCLIMGRIPIGQIEGFRLNL